MFLPPGVTIRVEARAVEVTVIVEVAEVPRTKSSTIEDLAGLFRPVVVSGEDVRPAGKDLTFAVSCVCAECSLGHGRVVDAYLDAGNRSSNTAEFIPTGRVARQKWGLISEAITDGDPPPQALQFR